MDTAFQADTFQNDAFQIAASTTAKHARGAPAIYILPEPEPVDEDWIVVI